MLSEFRKKKLILDNRKPFSPGVHKQIREANLLDFVWSIVVPAGMTCSKKAVLAIMRGEYLPDSTLEENIFIRNLSAAAHQAEAFAAMPAMLGHPLIRAAYGAIAQSEPYQYRENNAILDELAYRPPDFKLIRERLDLFINWTQEPERDRDPILTAACIHNRLIEMYPFSQHTEALAIWLMQYSLMSSGLPTVDLFREKTAYYQMLEEYIRTRDIIPFTRMIASHVSAKLAHFLDLTD